MVASKGNGAEGLMPAYVDAVYLVSVQNVTIQHISQPHPDPDLPPRVPPRVPPRDPDLPPRPRLPLERFELSKLVVASKSPVDPALSPGVLARAVNPALAVRSPPASSDIMLNRRLLTDETPALATSSVATLQGGQISKLSAIKLQQRFAVVDAFVNGRTLPPPTRTDETTVTEIYVAGFGCKKIPFAPNPNVNYHW